MTYTHCETNNNNLSLHDCIVDKASYENGKLCFGFSDGFWILQSHPENPLSEVVRTDASKAEYALEFGNEYDVGVFVFERTFFKKTIRTEWSLQQLVDRINAGKCRLELLYQYTGETGIIIECDLRLNKKPYHKECVLKIFASEVRYYWNNLVEENKY